MIPSSVSPTDCKFAEDEYVGFIELPQEPINTRPWRETKDHDEEKSIFPHRNNKSVRYFLVELQTIKTTVLVEYDYPALGSTVHQSFVQASVSAESIFLTNINCIYK